MMNKLLIVRIVLFILAAAVIGFIVHQQPNIKVSNIKTPDVTPKVAEVGSVDAKASTKSVPVPQPVPTPAPVPTPVPVIVTPPPAPQPVVTPVSAISDQDAKMYIYNHESGNNPLAKNSIGCLGIGQSCSPAVLLSACPTLNYACEDAFFTSYAVNRYGGWIQAYSFWLGHSWW